MEEDAGAESSDTSTAQAGRSSQEVGRVRRFENKTKTTLKPLLFFTELDEAAQAELDAIRGNLAKYKGKYGKDIGIDELDWVGGV